MSSLHIVYESKRFGRYGDTDPRNQVANTLHTPAFPRAEMR